MNKFLLLFILAAFAMSVVGCSKESEPNVQTDDAGRKGRGLDPERN